MVASRLPFVSAIVVAPGIMLEYDVEPYMFTPHAYK